MGCCGSAYQGYSWNQSEVQAAAGPVDLTKFCKLVFVGDRIGSEEFRTGDGTRYLFGSNAFHREAVMPNGHAEELLQRHGPVFQKVELVVPDNLTDIADADEVVVDEPSVTVPDVADVVGAMAAAVPNAVSLPTVVEDIFDFTILRGIGPVIKNTLYDHGIMTLREFVSTDMAVLGRLLVRFNDEMIEDLLVEARTLLQETVDATV